MTTNDQFFYSLRYLRPFLMMLRSLTIHFLASSNKRFQLKAISPTSFQQWVDKIQQCQHHQLEHLSISIPINILPGECTHFTPVYEFLANYSPSQTHSHQDSDDNHTPASSLWPRLLNKQGKDYSKESASTIQQEYVSTKSSRKSMLEANKKSLSAHSVLESDEGRISMLLITNSFSSPFLLSIIQI